MIECRRYVITNKREIKNTLIFHSDKGTQYVTKEFSEKVKNNIQII